MNFVRILFLFFLPFSLFAQKGDLYLYNHLHPFSQTDHKNYACLQDDRGIMYFANTKGVLTYNGVRWQLTSTQSTPYALGADNGSRGKIYVGCGEALGYLEHKPNGRIEYQIIAKFTKEFGPITKIISLGSLVYFYSDKMIYEVSAKNQEVNKIWLAKNEFPYAGAFSFRNQLYVNFYGFGLHRLEDKEFRLVNVSNWNGDEYINMAINLAPEKMLLGTNRNKLYLFDGVQTEPFILDAQKYINENLLSGGMDLPGDKFALSTLSGGCLVIDKKSASVLQTINYQTGLPDDEILSMCSDRQGGLWLCTEFSITRADLNLPIQNFSEYPGLEGKITTVNAEDSILFVATTEGLYYLEKVDAYEELVTVIQKEKERLTEVQTSIEKTFKYSDNGEKNRLQRFFQTLFGSKEQRLKNREIRRKKKEGRKNKNQDANERVEDEEWNVPIERASSIIKKTKPEFKETSTVLAKIDRKIQKSYALQSIPYVYKKVEGLHTKCKQLVNFKNQLLAATNTGLFEIKKQKAIPILNNLPVNFIYQSEHNENQFYIGTALGMYLLEWQGSRWKVNDVFKDFKNPIFSIAQVKQTLWAGGENLIYKIEVNQEGKPLSFRKYSLDQNYSQPVVTRNIDQKALFFFADSVYVFDPAIDRFVREKEISKYYPTGGEVFFNQAGFTWTRPESRWINIHSLGNYENLQSTFLSLFRDIEDIFVDGKNNLWIITENSLFKVEGNAQPYQGEGFPVFVSAVKDNEGNFLAVDEVKLPVSKNSITIELGSGFFLGEKFTQYQFRIEGIQKNWSAWNTNPSVVFPYLEPGNYRIQFRAKNLFGQNSKTYTLRLKIIPRFWERWWFYALLGILAAAIVLVTIRLRVRALEKVNKKLELKIRRATTEIEQNKKLLEIAFDEIAQKNKDISSSIKYAHRIQQAILPFEQEMNATFDGLFILYLPKDVVSGDFYWYQQKREADILILADCTGHGVPGAFMSMIGYSLLSQIINERNILDPSEILYQLNLGVIKALKQYDETNSIWDGMDISICVIHKNKRQLIFAGANQSLLFVQQEELKIIPADKNGIGGVLKKHKKFTNHYLNITQDTFFYLLSDGYTDQFGGEENKKFSKARFKNIISKIAAKDALEQKVILEQSLKDWQMSKSQVDDILVIGFRLGKDLQ